MCVLTGKGHTLTWLHSQGIFPLDAFVRVSTVPTILFCFRIVSAPFLFLGLAFFLSSFFSFFLSFFLSFLSFFFSFFLSSFLSIFLSFFLSFFLSIYLSLYLHPSLTSFFPSVLDNLTSLSFCLSDLDF